MDHLDPKWLGFVIYLGLRMHQFQKYRLLWPFIYLSTSRTSQTQNTSRTSRPQVTERKIIAPIRGIKNHNSILISFCSESDEDTKPKCQTLPKVPDLNAVEKCTNFLSLKATKVFVVVCTLGLMATSIYGNYMIEEEFDPWLFLDPYSYPAAFKANKDRYFPEKGENVLLFFRYRLYIT